MHSLNGLLIAEPKSRIQYLATRIQYPATRIPKPLPPWLITQNNVSHLVSGFF